MKPKFHYRFSPFSPTIRVALTLAASMIGVTMAQAQDTVIQPVSVTLENGSSSGTSSTVGPYLQYPGSATTGILWYDGSGLASALATGDPVPVSWPAHAAYTNTNSSRVRDTSETADGAPPAVQGQATLVFNLGGSFTLKGIALWNGNESGGTPVLNTTRGVETMALSYSSDGVSFTSGETLTFTEESAGVDVDAQVQTLTANVPGVTHVKMVINNFGPAQTILNFGEIRMISAAPPGLKWASGSDNWTATDVWEDETVTPATFADGENVLFEDSKSGAGPITVTLNATVSPLSTRFDNSTKDYTISGTGTISGATGLIKDGTASATLATANDYSGGTTLNAGQLNIDHASALGTGTFTITGGTIDSTSGAIVNANNNPMDWNAGITFVGSNNLDLGTGAVTLGGPRTVDVQANQLTVGGEISGGAFSLSKIGSGTLTLTGISTYTGDTTVSDGTLEFAEATGEAVSNDSRLNIDASGGVLLTQNETVRSLYIDGTPQPSGTYGRPGLGGVTYEDAHFTGDAILTVAQADELSWDTSATAGFQKASGDWNTTATNWSPAGTVLSAWSEGATANFGGDDSSATITLTQDLDALGMNFLNSNYNLVGDASPRTVTMGDASDPGSLLAGNIKPSPSTTTTLGSNLTVTSDANLNIGMGNDIDSGTLGILAGATVETSTGDIGGIGDINLTGLNTTVNVAGVMRTTGTAGQFNGTGRINLGTGQPSGTDVYLNIQAGGQVLIQSFDGESTQSGANVMNVGNAASSIADPALVKGTITVASGGLLQVGSSGERSIRLGQFGTGTLDIQTGGLVQAGSLALGNGGSGTGYLNLNGGTLETSDVFFNKPASEANFDGGTIKVTGATGGTVLRAGSASATANILDGGLTIDTNGLDTSATQDLEGSGTGGLTKTGAGTLLLTGFNTYNGATTVSAGCLTIDEISAVPGFSGVTVAAGAGFGGIVGPSNLLDADIQDIVDNVTWTSGSFLVIDTNGADVTVAANITGNIGLIKKGAGVLTLTGTNTYSGATVIEGGSIAGFETSITDVSIVKSGDNVTLTFTSSGNVDVYRSSDLVTWGAAYATDQASPYTDAAATGPKFFYVLVPTGVPYP